MTRVVLEAGELWGGAAVSDKGRPLDKLDEVMVEGRRASDVAELVLAGLSVPVVAPVLQTWIGQNSQREMLERVREVVVDLDDRLNRLEETGELLAVDERWAELTTETLRLVARTARQEKRESFAYLLSNAAKRHSQDERDEARSMAYLLNQLEYRHVQLLDELMNRPSTQSYIGSKGGAYRQISLRLEEFEPRDVMRLHYLESVGLMAFDDLSEVFNPDSEAKAAVTSLGVAFHKWVSDPAEEE